MFSVSRSESGRPPRPCAYCRERFQGQPYTGHSGAVYCSPQCRSWACDELTADDVARSVTEPPAAR